ncbi:hypothetical protein BG004_007236, partial [Podila humilis]
MALGANIKSVFEQIGIFEEFTRLGKPGILIEGFDSHLRRQYHLNFTERVIASGSLEYIISRRDLYNLLWRQVSKERIHLNKKMYKFDQDEDGVTIHCADNTSYSGDILVGADGANSIVRRQLYKSLKAERKLPASDALPMPFLCTCLVGQTIPLDPEEFPHIKIPLSQALSVFGDNEYTWATYTTAQNTICWTVLMYLDKKATKPEDATAHNAEWGPSSAQATTLAIRDFKIPGGKDGNILTLGDIIDNTPKEVISKVMLEEKVFDTWHSDRTVLMGDACHKLNPAGGSGATSAIHDAITLANWINVLTKPSLSNLNEVFREYHAERHPVVTGLSKT